MSNPLTSVTPDPRKQVAGQKQPLSGLTDRKSPGLDSYVSSLPVSVPPSPHPPRLSRTQKTSQTFLWFHLSTFIFNKARATSLPPHRKYDCIVDLLPNTSPHRHKLYSLSGPECQAMDKYIEDSLAAVLIQPSSRLSWTEQDYC